MTEGKYIALGRHEVGHALVSVEIKLKGKTGLIYLDPNRATQRYILDILREGQPYEGETVQALADCLEPSATFFDVGAHVGYFSVVASILGARAIAFEPAPENQPYLFRNLEQWKNNRCAFFAVSDVCNREVEFFVNADNDGGHSLWPPSRHQHNTSADNCINIRSVALDMFQDFRPQAIKIDTEGAEVLVLRGASEVLKQPQLKLVICEINEFGLAQLGHKPEEIFNLMRDSGFQAEFKQEPGLVCNAFFRR